MRLSEVILRLYFDLILYLRWYTQVTFTLIKNLLIRDTILPFMCLIKHGVLWNDLRHVDPGSLWCYSLFLILIQRLLTSGPTSALLKTRLRCVVRDIFNTRVGHISTIGSLLASMASSIYRRVLLIHLR